MFSVSLGFISCEDPFAGDDFAAYTEEPIGIYLETKPDYSSWVKLLKRADLYNALNVNDDFTCFVANNEAVTRYLKEIKFSSIDDLSEEQAKSVVAYHIVPFTVLNQEALGGQFKDKTVSGSYLLVEADAADPTAPKYLNGVKIINYNQTVINGVIHELEDVLQPPLYSVGELINASDRYTIFKEAVKLAGLESYLNLRDIVVGYGKVIDFKTVLAVSDSVFRVNGIENIADLREKYVGDPDDVLNQFYNFVAYHIIPESYDYTSLITKLNEADKGRNFLTYAKNQFITITDNGGLYSTINSHDPIGKEVSFLMNRLNSIAINGYVHEVDKLMDIVAPQIYPYEYDLATGKEFEVLDYYKGPDTKKIKVFENDDSLEFIKMVTIPAGKGILKYVNYGNIWNMPMHDNDWLVVELGDMGSVEFTIPPIIPGNYNMVLYKWQYGPSVDYATDRRRPGTTLIFNNNIRVGEVHYGSGVFRHVVGKTQIVEMSENKLLFKLTKPGPIGFDIIRFEPIE